MDYIKKTLQDHTCYMQVSRSRDGFLYGMTLTFDGRDAVLVNMYGSMIDNNEIIPISKKEFMDKCKEFSEKMNRKSELDNHLYK